MAFPFYPTTRERPIIFSAPMVRAILAGTKTQTRRVLRPQPHEDLADTVHYDRATGGAMWASIHGDHGVACPYGKPGDQLWVRETHAGDNCCGWVYRADHPTADISAGDLDDGEQSLRRWTPAIHMKREACRLRLGVVDVRVERLQSISEDDAKAEGIELGRDGRAKCALRGERVHESAVAAYRCLWDSLNEKRAPWASNPWLWVIEVKRGTA